MSFGSHLKVFCFSVYSPSYEWYRIDGKKKCRKKRPKGIMSTYRNTEKKGRKKCRMMKISKEKMSII
jgi:hypothetical protein